MAEPRKKKETRDDRIYFRATSAQRQMLEQAAAASGKTLTSFVLESACLEAQRALTDRRLFLLDDEQWQQFMDALDQPAVDKPRLRAFLQNPAVVD